MTPHTEPEYPSSTEPPTITVSPVAVPQTQHEPRHPMVTRSRTGHTKPKQPLPLHTEIISPLPKSHLQVLEDPNWNPAVNEEYDALIKNGM